VTEFKKDTIAGIVIKRNTIPLSENRRFTQKIDKSRWRNQKIGVILAE
jgi:hypothetical protein